jgi:hypothetical protein
MALALNKFRLLTKNLVSGSNTIYQENIDVATIILSCQITNITSSIQSCDVAIQKSGSLSQITLLRNAVIPVDESLNPLAGKIVLERNDAFVIKTSVSGSLDVILSVLENAIN